METNTKFKADPYNFSNHLLQENDILKIMKLLQIDNFWTLIKKIIKFSFKELCC